MSYTRKGLRLGLVLLAVMMLAPLLVTQTAPIVVAQDEAVTIDLEELNDSGISGTATLTPMGDQTEVTVQLEAGEGAMLDVERPNHIHSGQCGESLGGVEYPLTDVTDEATTTVDASLETLMDGNHAINVHQSADEISVYVACGNIPAAEEAPETLPETGATQTNGTAGISFLLVAFGAAMLAVSGAVLFVQRRQRR